MKQTLFTVALLLSMFASAQFNVQKVNIKDVPKSIKGKVIHAVKWTDGEGQHLLVASELIQYSKGAPDEGFQDGLLFAYHFILNGDSLKQTWKVYDFSNDCPVDLTVRFIKNAFAITDFDNDNIAEVWIMYKVACRGGVDPADLKIIMYEGNKKHAMRGTTKVAENEKQFIGGTHTIDVAFRKAPGVFRKYAESLWKKNMLETWD